MNANFEDALAGKMATSATPVSDTAIQTQWPVFAKTVRHRLEVGARAYGDASFRLPADRLAEEIDQELLDVMGWGFILWRRVQVLMEELRELEAAASKKESE